MSRWPWAWRWAAGARRADGPRTGGFPTVTCSPRLRNAITRPRTRRNIEDADGTLILNLGALDGGTALTARHARQIGKPCLVVTLEEGIEPAAFRDWLAANAIAVLNVAGPRESQRPGVYAAACRCLEALLRAVLPPERT